MIMSSNRDRLPIPKKGTQCDAVLRYMREFGSITALQAMQGFQCYRLAARIKDLRDMGYSIETRTDENNKGTHARYKLFEHMEVDGVQIPLYSKATLELV